MNKNSKIKWTNKQPQYKILFNQDIREITNVVRLIAQRKLMFSDIDSDKV